MSSLSPGDHSLRKYWTFIRPFTLLVPATGMIAGALMALGAEPKWQSDWGETSTQIALHILAGALLAIYLFFKKRRAFPRVAIGFLAAGLSVLILDLIVLQAIPAARAQIGASDIGGVAKAGLGAAIWIPYFIRSKRVHATFVR